MFLHLKNAIHVTLYIIRRAFIFSSSKKTMYTKMSSVHGSSVLTISEAVINSSPASPDIGVRLLQKNMFISHDPYHASARPYFRIQHGRGEVRARGLLECSLSNRKCGRHGMIC